MGDEDHAVEIQRLVFGPLALFLGGLPSDDHIIAIVLDGVLHPGAGPADRFRQFLLVISLKIGVHAVHLGMEAAAGTF
jgi:hypothetical protein